MSVEEQTSWVTSPAALDRLVARIEEENTPVTFDYETTGLDEREPGAAVVLASFTLEGGDTFVLPLWHPESPFLGSWRRVLRRVMLSIGEGIGHNVKFDVRWTHATVGVDLSSKIVWDTMTSSQLLDENALAKLKERAPATFGIERWDDDVDFSKVRADAVPVFDLGLYAARDTYWTWRLYRAHRAVLVDEPATTTDARLGRLMTRVSMPTLRTLSGVEIAGMTVDPQWCTDLLTENEERLVELEKEICRLYPAMDPAGFSMAPTSHWFRDLTQLAVENGELEVLATTPKGAPQWNKSVLGKLARKGFVLAELVLDARNRTKQNEFLRSWLRYAALDGKVHTSYGSVITGRLSSSEPNMQQVAKGLKGAFVARPGHVLAEIDYSQIELRVGAFISRSKPMIEAFQRGEDLHRLLASQINRIPLDRVTADQRQAAKAINFGLLFLMSPAGLRYYAAEVYGVDMSSEEAVVAHRVFFETWTGLSEWHSATIVRAHRTGEVVSPIGRVRRLPGIHQEWSRGEAERQGVNSPVQGFASDIMQTAMAWISGQLPGRPGVHDARVVGTVHDSAIIEMPEADAERVLAECCDRMRRVPEVLLAELDCDFDVPLEVEAEIGRRWGRG